ncbi:hypothetical protein [Shewanella putrefaciens]|uniref:hypothetical protein n=1 Tax=Shewanella putrefaciens TaxID=24 RepID=UPI00285B3078|nr:hypothetical protein [Shewanella putrefaciens]MDR6965080.1 hypothetical protein [Shewanella putrefaciens]
MYSMISKLTQSSESGWGTAFKVGKGFQVYQQSLFWLICKGIPYKNTDLKLSYFMGSEVISCHFSIEVLKELLDIMQVPYFLDEDQVRWILPHNVSSIFYAQWKCRVALDLNTTNIEYCLS